MAKTVLKRERETGTVNAPPVHGDVRPLRLIQPTMVDRRTEHRAPIRAELARRADRIAAFFTSDLDRAVETVAIAFADSTVSVLHDWRLRECDYGDCNGMPAAELQLGRRTHLEVPYPGGERWPSADAAARVSRRRCRTGCRRDR